MVNNNNSNIFSGITIMTIVVTVVLGRYRCGKYSGYVSFHYQCAIILNFDGHNRKNSSCELDSLSCMNVHSVFENCI
jgi:hypothetical protein